MTNKQSRAIGYLRNNFSISNYASLIGMVVLFIIYVIVRGGDITPYNLKTIVNQSVIIAVVAIGATFIFSTGAFDIALGAATLVAAITGVLVHNATESVVLMFLSCLAVGILIELVNATLSAVFNLPVFIMTIAMMNILTAVGSSLIGSRIELQLINTEVSKAIDQLWVKLVVLLVFFSLAAFLFYKTELGRKNKFLGGNAICAELTGISYKKQMIKTFLFAGVGIGLAAFLLIGRAPTIGKQTASSLGMDVLIAIVFGGMPLSGGSKSKMSACIIGAFSIVLLDQILLYFNLDYGVNQIIKGALFLAVVYIAAFSYKTKLLPR